jgi:predicted nucleotidyltransferase
LVIDRLQAALQADGRIAYALLFGSAARGTVHAQSDLDVAVGVDPQARLSVRDIGDLTSRLETAAGRAVHLVVLDEAPPGLAYRVFRDGVRLTVRDEDALKARLARAILEYLDFQPIEEMFTRGVLRARHGR